MEEHVAGNLIMSQPSLNGDASGIKYKRTVQSSILVAKSKQTFSNCFGHNPVIDVQDDAIST